MANLGQAIHLQLSSVRVPQAKEDVLLAITLLARNHTPELVATFLDFSTPPDRCPAPLPWLPALQPPPCQSTRGPTNLLKPPTHGAPLGRGGSVALHPSRIPHRHPAQLQPPLLCGERAPHNPPTNTRASLSLFPGPPSCSPLATTALGVGRPFPHSLQTRVWRWLGSPNHSWEPQVLRLYHSLHAAPHAPLWGLEAVAPGHPSTRSQGCRVCPPPAFSPCRQHLLSPGVLSSSPLSHPRPRPPLSPVLSQMPSTVPARSRWHTAGLGPPQPPAPRPPSSSQPLPCPHLPPYQHRLHLAASHAHSLNRSRVPRPLVTLCWQNPTGVTPGCTPWPCSPAASCREKLTSTGFQLPTTHPERPGHRPLHTHKTGLDGVAWVSPGSASTCPGRERCGHVSWGQCVPVRVSSRLLGLLPHKGGRHVIRGARGREC